MWPGWLMSIASGAAILSGHLATTGKREVSYLSC
jgi:hypothetical protein